MVKSPLRILPPLPTGRRRVEPGIIVTALIVLALDQITKYWVSATLGPTSTVHSVEVVGNWVRLSYTTNSGAAFGMFPAATVIFSIVAIVAIPVLLLARSYVADRAWWITVVFGMLLGGAIGNLLGRLRLGHVVDFIDVGVGTLRWPSFNIADSAFVIGIIVLALYLSFSGSPSKDSEPESREDNQRPDTSHAV